MQLAITSRDILLIRGNAPHVFNALVLMYDIAVKMHGSFGDTIKGRRRRRLALAAVCCSYTLLTLTAVACTDSRGNQIAGILRAI